MSADPRHILAVAGAATAALSLVLGVALRDDIACGMVETAGLETIAPEVFADPGLGARRAGLEALAAAARRGADTETGRRTALIFSDSPFWRGSGPSRRIASPLRACAIVATDAEDAASIAALLDPAAPPTPPPAAPAPVETAPDATASIPSPAPDESLPPHSADPPAPEASPSMAPRVEVAPAPTASPSPAFVGSNEQTESSEPVPTPPPPLAPPAVAVLRPPAAPVVAAPISAPSPAAAPRVPARVSSGVPAPAVPSSAPAPQHRRPVARVAPAIAARPIVISPAPPIARLAPLRPPLAAARLELPDRAHPWEAAPLARRYAEPPLERQWSRGDAALLPPDWRRIDTPQGLLYQARQRESKGACSTGSTNAYFPCPKAPAPRSR